MNIPSEKHSHTPLLPTINPTVHTVPTKPRDDRSLPERLHALMGAITRFVDNLFESLALALLVAIQIICLGTVLAQTAALAYLFSTGRKTMTPESALEVVCVVAPFLVIGMGTRFIEMLALFLETWRQWIQPKVEN